MTASQGAARRCLVVQPIHPAGIEILKQAGIEPLHLKAHDAASVLAAAPAADAVITRNAGFSAEAIAVAPNLKVIAVHGVGTDAVAIPAATARGIPVVNTPDVNAQSVAEHALALTFALAKAIPLADAATRSGDTAFKYRVPLRELDGATFGVVGLGAIGQATTRLARGIGMRVLAFSRGQPDAVFAACGAERAPSLEALLADSDVVSLHLPLNTSTRGLIGARELGLMKRSAFLVNTARGGLVDQDALVEALETGEIAGAGLDVFPVEPLPVTSPLASLANLVLSPHLAGSTTEAMGRMAVAAARQVVDVLAGRLPAHPVNPEAWHGPPNAEAAP